MATAYLVLFLRTDKPVPLFAGLGIFGEPHPTTALAMSTYAIASTEALSYERAEQKLRDDILTQIGPLSWMAKWILLSPAEQKALLRQ